MILPFDFRKAVCGSADSNKSVCDNDNEYYFSLLISSLQNKLSNTPADRRSADRRSAKLFLVSSGDAFNDSLSAGLTLSELSAHADRCYGDTDICNEPVVGEADIAATKNQEVLNHADTAPVCNVTFKGKPVTKEYIDFISESPAEQALFSISVSSSSIYIKSKKRP
ncbi:hypothetical protein KFO32_09160 [Pantoea ananatis]|uniref:hypothetical protein n=1 Tax=Pantoea ananas TaxID=553 RepID=UPI001FF47384|nr:hypothetical protein [Pantoea ananatis]MCK0553226.1 hypothetical protein [Pantoea ananatis]